MNQRPSPRRRIAALSLAAWTLAVLVPATLTTAALGLLPGAEGEAFAQGNPADAITEVARQRYQEGVKAFDAGKFEDARAAFLQTYALKRVPAVLLNLAQAELRSNHPEDAGNHFEQFLREMPNAAPDQKTAAQKGVADAKKKAGFVIVIVDVLGADVSIDGGTLGRAPVIDPVFVKPGKHTFFATYQGKSATVVVDAKAGIASTATLTTNALGGEATQAPVPVPVPPAPPPTQPEPPPTTQAPPPPVPPVAATPALPPWLGEATPPPEPAPGEREPFAHWYKRKPIAWVGTGITGLGLLGGIIFAADAGLASSASKLHTTQIGDAYYGLPYKTPTPLTASQVAALPALCGNASTGAGAIAPQMYGSACTLLRKDRTDYNTDVVLSGVSWGLFGVGLVGTFIYAKFDWYNKTGSAASAAAKPSTEGPRLLSLAPIVSPRFSGMGASGEF